MPVRNSFEWEAFVFTSGKDSAEFVFRVSVTFGVAPDALPGELVATRAPRNFASFCRSASAMVYQYFKYRVQVCIDRAPLVVTVAQTTSSSA